MKPLASNQTEAEFWVRHARGGVASSILTIVTGLVYAVATRDQPGRQALGVLLLVALVCTAGVLGLPLRRIVVHRLGLLFFYTWSFAVCVMVAVAIWVDGGVASPLVFTLFLPLIYGAMTYPPLGVSVLGAVVMGIYAGIGLASPGTETARVLLGTAILALVTLMCARTARIHWSALEGQTALARQLQNLVDRDGLTGCLNRCAFHERLDIEVKHRRRHGRPLSLLVVDLDGFKAVNDAHGHLTGDELLRQVGHALREVGRPSDVAGRLGGDEFALLLPDTDGHGAMEVAERVRRHVVEATGTYRVTASIGAAVATDEDHDGRTLMERADTAVYAAKRDGRDRVQIAASGGGETGDASPAGPPPTVAGDSLSDRTRMATEDGGRTHGRQRTEAKR